MSKARPQSETRRAARSFGKPFRMTFKNNRKRTRGRVLQYIGNKLIRHTF